MVGENVGYGLARRGVARAETRERVGAMLERVGLGGASDKRVDQLSGGQRQRVAIARSLVLEPTLLLLDEPLGALDLKLREHMKIELKQLQAAFGTTFVYITHDQSEALVLSDQVAVMNPGRFEQVGTPQELYYEPATPFVAGFVGANNRHRRARATAVDGDSPSSSRRTGWRCCARRSGSVAAGDAVEAFVRPEVAAARHAMPPHCAARPTSVAGGASRACCSTAPIPPCCCARRAPRSSSASRCRRPAASPTSQVGEPIVFSFDPQRAVCFASRGRRHAAETAAAAPAARLLLPAAGAGAALAARR